MLKLILSVVGATIFLLAVLGWVAYSAEKQAREIKDRYDRRNRRQYY